MLHKKLFHLETRFILSCTNHLETEARYQHLQIADKYSHDKYRLLSFSMGSEPETETPVHPNHLSGAHFPSGSCARHIKFRRHARSSVFEAHPPKRLRYNMRYWKSVVIGITVVACVLGCSVFVYFWSKGKLSKFWFLWFVVTKFVCVCDRNL